MWQMLTVILVVVTLLFVLEAWVLYKLSQVDLHGESLRWQDPRTRPQQKR